MPSLIELAQLRDITRSQMEGFIAICLRVLLVPLLRPFTGLFHDVQDGGRGFGTADWYTVNGRIESVNTAHDGFNDWVITLLYSYSAGGEYWSGEISRRFFTEADADAYAQQHPINSLVVVRYQPGNVSRSVVLKQDQFSVSAAGTI